MTANESAKQRADIAASLLDITDALGPVFDTADGVRADLERRGWSPTAAESAASVWLDGALAHVWKSQA